MPGVGAKDATASKNGVDSRIQEAQQGETFKIMTSRISCFYVLILNPTHIYFSSSLAAPYIVLKTPV